jgi:hypothetical protein
MRPDLRIPALYFEMDDSLCEQYELCGVRVHRISQYKSKDENSILEVRECRDFDVGSRPVPGPGRPRTVFYAISNIEERDRVPCDKLDYWHEVSVSSAQAMEIFEQNLQLELGEEASWNLSEVKAAEAIYLPSLEMLRKMDGVGWWNDNGVDVKKVPPPPPRQAQQPYIFW